VLGGSMCLGSSAFVYCVFVWHFLAQLVAKKKKLGIAEKNVTRVDQKQGQKHIEGYKGVRTPLKLDFRYCFLLL